jgi:RNA polymerase sigma factor (sigma-70 family)
MLPVSQSDTAATFELLWNGRRRLGALLGKFRIPHSDQEDLLQEAYLILLRAPGTVANPDAFLYCVTRNLCRAYWRQRRRRLYDAVDASSIEAFRSTATSPEDNALRREIRSAIGHLPDRCRTLLRLRYQQGVEGSQLAETLGYRVSGIRRIAERCLGALVRKLAAPRGLAQRC